MIECRGRKEMAWLTIEEGVGVIDYRGGSWCDRV